jgi:hypothetical protein
MHETKNKEENNKFTISKDLKTLEVQDSASNRALSYLIENKIAISHYISNRRVSHSWCAPFLYARKLALLIASIWIGSFASVLTDCFRVLPGGTIVEYKKGRNARR